MTTRSPSSCLRAVSSFHSPNHHALFRQTALQRTLIAFTGKQPQICRWASSSSSSSQPDLSKPEQTALAEIEGLKTSDPINPSRSTLPPPLKLPTRRSENIALYYFRIGRAYGSFYWVGIKAVWFNYQAATQLRERIRRQAGEKKVSRSQEFALMTRSEFQLLARNSHDIGKLPFFGLLVALFGEWLPVIVPFIPGAVPGTCRIPKQIEGMRKKAEERRRSSFRQGISEPAEDQLRLEAAADANSSTEYPISRKEYAAQMLSKLRDDQLFHLSSTLNLHNRIWDRIQLPPPSFLLRRGLSKHLSYLGSDDFLLERYGGAFKLSTEEVEIACEERGLDVLGRPEQKLRENLTWWLARQKDDKGKGSAILAMLFRRPNAWEGQTPGQTKISRK
ncbi:uncharacterized protein MYCFIDRAFT_57472 [Pseudocercospora fijiensis CIRAD86]|uniref:Letm1 RBD domain-containing protein n=1 Tax=Pseudocercospora fijiensis (strain CIRAD86) TaxID=383855 RepID=M2ZFS1_PSEFD|nr:uncharacterized protein MYCFIDRAFT_57472 [Pseudocercospora fijiensis CIRAD86]EME77994.1 hypothetical protein MYCFIDRAFT_57472 [Pseudocercospora fijiensis CIRAD86]